jgi:heat-inducible transcriptional repressor
MRREAVLERIINCYVDSAEPVCSRTISKKIGLSSATIRNVMQDLEEEGLIVQPYTSAGRVPTEKGYRYYVDSLMHLRKLTEGQIKAIDAEYRSRMKSLDDILRKTSHVLSRITRCAGVVLLPKTKSSHFKHVDLIPLGRYKVLVLLITESGVAKEFIIRLDYDLDRDTLNKVANFLNGALYDMTLDEIKAHIASTIRAKRDSSYMIVAQARDILDALVTSHMDGRLYIDGASLMLAQPEFGDLHKVRAMLGFLERQKSLLDILSDDISSMDTRILIGHENKTKDLSDMSLVTCGYRIRDDVIGRLGVIGPTRMSYDKVVPMVNFLAETLTHILAEIEE